MKRQKIKNSIIKQLKLDEPGEEIDKVGDEFKRIYSNYYQNMA